MLTLLKHQVSSKNFELMKFLEKHAMGPCPLHYVIYGNILTIWEGDPTKERQSEKSYVGYIESTLGMLIGNMRNSFKYEKEKYLLSVTGLGNIESFSIESNPNVWEIMPYLHIGHTVVKYPLLTGVWRTRKAVIKILDDSYTVVQNNKTEIHNNLISLPVLNGNSYSI